jgi:hypothetical protein
VIQSSIDQLWDNQKALGKSVRAVEWSLAKIMHIISPDEFPNPPEPDEEAKNEEPEGTPGTETVPA